METFRSLNERLGPTIILVTHEQEVAEYARRTIQLRDGQVVRDEASCAQEAVVGTPA